MKIRTLIIGTGTVLVLLAPAATAAPSKTIPRQAAGHKIVQKPSAIAKPAQKNASTPTIFTAPFPPWPIVTPHYIYIPGFAGSASNVSEPDCASSYSNCTAQELCDIWGENCPPPTTQAPPVTPT